MTYEINIIYALEKQNKKHNKAKRVDLTKRNEDIVI